MMASQVHRFHNQAKSLPLLAHLAGEGHGHGLDLGVGLESVLSEFTARA